MSISIRLNPEEEKLFRTYAKENNLSLSELFRSSVLERIEDEYDIEIYKKALEEYNNDPVSYTTEEVCEMLGLWITK